MDRRQCGQGAVWTDGSVDRGYGHVVDGGVHPPPPLVTATEAGGRHPTGMHTCSTDIALSSKF